MVAKTGNEVRLGLPLPSGMAQTKQLVRGGRSS
jgi:hypothetical protein